MTSGTMNDFLSRMSHDLRTPLNTVLGFAQLLELEQLTPEQHDCVQQILRGGRRLADLISEGLDIARIDAGRLSLSSDPVDVREIVRNAVDLVVPQAAARDITLAIEDEPETRATVIADRQRLGQILLNLLSNGVKYNRHGGRVSISHAAFGAGKYRIRVTDTGSGISPDKLQLLFTPFERLGAESTPVEGTGLGLALSQRLAEAMGGSLGVVSEVDRGSTFWLELPSGDRTERLDGARRHAALQAAARQATVLYVEDNVSNVRLMERVLSKRRGVTLVHVLDGKSGVQTAGELKPELILLDLNLPDLTGEDVLRQLREDPATHSIPVVVLTADGTPGRMENILAAGATAYLTKPLDVAAVLSTIDELLSRNLVGR